MLHGTVDRPHLLLRFNTVIDHQSNTNPIVQFVVHDGKDGCFMIHNVCVSRKFEEGEFRYENIC